jgi:uncharacterized protein involved in exopolysaccharide biosynthesis
MDGVMTAGGLPLWSDYPRFVRRRLGSIGLLVVAGLLVGLLWSWGHTTTYSATASVMLTPVPKYVTPSTVTLVPPPVTIDTDAQLLQHPEVLTAVADAVGGDATTAAGHLSVSADPNTRVLNVTVTAGSPSAAAQAANAAVGALADVRRATLGALRLDQARQLRVLIDQQEELMSRTSSHGVVVPAYDQGSADILELSTALEDLEEARARPLEVVSSATPPRSADYANTEVPLVSGAMVGLLCGCLLGAARDRAARLAPPGPAHSMPGRHPFGGPSTAPTDEDHAHV